jgi:Ribbon-helix-helix protein
MSGKDSGLRIRIERPLRDEFLRVCRSQDKPASQVLRQFMRDYVTQNTANRTEAPDKTTAKPASE